MEARNLTYDQQQDVEAHAPYLRVWVALLVLTVMEYVYARVLAGGSAALLIGGLLAMAAVKAVLVALYFMHLKFEGRWVFLMIVPTLAMATILVVALYPDIGRPPAGTRANPDATPPPAAVLDGDPTPAVSSDR